MQYLSVRLRSKLIAHAHIDTSVDILFNLYVIVRCLNQNQVITVQLKVINCKN